MAVPWQPVPPLRLPRPKVEPFHRGVAAAARQMAASNLSESARFLSRSLVGLVGLAVPSPEVVQVVPLQEPEGLLAKR